MKTLIKNGTIVNEGKTFRGYLVVDGEHIFIMAKKHLVAVSTRQSMPRGVLLCQE